MSETKAQLSPGPRRNQSGWRRSKDTEEEKKVVKCGCEISTDGSVSHIMWHPWRLSNQ